MKSIIISLLLVFLSFKSFSQHNYENPREKSKRGLLEEPLEEKEVVEEDSTVDTNNDTKKISKKERKFCACEKTYFLSLKRLKLYNKLVASDIVNNDVSVWTNHDRHKNKANKAMKMIRSKYEIDEEYECEHDNLTFKKLSQYKKAINKLVGLCDIDLITE